MTVDPVESIGIHAALDIAHVLKGMTEVIDAALAEHDVIVHVLAEAFPEFHGFFV